MAKISYDGKEFEVAPFPDGGEGFTYFHPDATRKSWMRERFYVVRGKVVNPSKNDKPKDKPPEKKKPEPIKKVKAPASVKTKKKERLSLLSFF